MKSSNLKCLKITKNKIVTNYIQIENQLLTAPYHPNSSILSLVRVAGQGRHHLPHDLQDLARFHGDVMLVARLLIGSLVVF